MKVRVRYLVRAGIDRNKSKDRFVDATDIGSCIIEGFDGNIGKVKGNERSVGPEKIFCGTNCSRKNRENGSSKRRSS